MARPDQYIRGMDDVLLDDLAAEHQVLDNLVAPSGELWSYGDPNAPQSITGTASHWCRVATRRMNADDSGLVADGRLAQSVMTVARAYLSDSS